jgi:membrane dipeptidase
MGSAAGVLGPLLGFGRCRLLADSNVTVSLRAVDLVADTTVIDMLGLLTLDWRRLGTWQRGSAAYGEADFRSLARSGVRILNPAVEPASAAPYHAALEWLAGWNTLLDGQACFLGRILTVNDLLRIPARGQSGIILGFQNATHFRTPADVAGFHGLGQRISQLTYNERNRLGSGCYERRDTGLTDFGGSVVSAMNATGMAIDLSHSGERTSRETIDASAHPVLITHANCQALANHPRCKSDELIRRLAASGGVMGITNVRAFVATGGTATLDDLLAHYLHVARLVGVEHVGIGSDTDATARSPGTGKLNPFYQISGLEPEIRVFQIADGLLRRGLAPSDVALVLGGNFRRALASIWSMETWSPVDERATRRDPFCPARPAPRAP